MILRALWAILAVAILPGLGGRAPAVGAPAAAPGFDVPLDLAGMKLQGKSIIDAAGQEVWRIRADEGRGARVALRPGGGLWFAGQTHSESTASLVRKDLVPGSDYVFETRFALSRPQAFLAHHLIIAPRVADLAADKAYRISYRFVSPCPAGANCTGFFLSNTADEATHKDILRATPVAGARYRLAYGREYTAYTVVRNVEQGVAIEFILDDPTVPGDDEKPLFRYVDTSAGRITANGDACVQVGSGGLIYPAAPVLFREMRIYSLDRFAEMRRRDRGPQRFAAVDLAEWPRLPNQQTELPNVFADNMVLQRGKPIPVWGNGIEGDEVTVSLAGASVKARVKDGRWRAELDPLPAGGPYTLTVKGYDRTLEVKNVLVGEVWVLGGQSNMCWGLEATTEAEDEIPHSDYPSMRIFSGWHPAADTPQLNVAGGTWKVVSPALRGRFSAVGYYFGKEIHRRLGVPVGLIDTSTPGTGIETWMSEATAAAVYGKALHETPGVYPRGMQDPSVFYNGKVAPVMPMAVAGMIWYQGDGSTPERGYRYRDTLPALMADWRRGFAQGDLPFLVVQIPRYQGCSPEMRESQLLSVLGAKNAGLAVTLDAGEPENIHPRNKRPMGERLALLARMLAYGEKIEGSGPIYRRAEFREGKAFLSFDHAGGRLELRGEGGWEIRGADDRYVAAHAALTPDGRVQVWSDAVVRPAAVRYAWANVPEFSLFNREGLLASPFRTRDEGWAGSNAP